MRRYVDLVNQRQLIALLRGEPPPYTKESNRLLIAMRDFETAYGIYGEFHRAMERYWCLRWLLQEKIQITNAQVIKENLVKLDRIPLVTRVPTLPEIAPGTYVQLKLSEIDPAVDQVLRQDIADMQVLKVNRTPGFFVNGTPLRDFGEAPLKALVEQELKKGSSQTTENKAR